MLTIGSLNEQAEAATKNEFPNIQGNFWLSSFTGSNNWDRAWWSHRAVYQHDESTQSFCVHKEGAEFTASDQLDLNKDATSRLSYFKKHKLSYEIHKAEHTPKTSWKNKS